MKRAQFWLLAIGFDLYWALAVGVRERVELPVAIVALLALWLSPRGCRGRLLLVTLAGVALDSLWLMLDLFRFTGSNALPLWMYALWLTFACWWRTVLNAIRLPLRWLAALGAISGPCSYLIGERLGAMQLQQSATLVWPLLAGGWALYLPLTHWLLYKPAR
ncbi:DUF2878 domain-containing protein [Erwinia sp. V71]|uniref:DUF2878 domain-containing protein n=1 Tax=Erwinia sp. V71 TaxID=3369424 RepID=UPI003F647971